MNKNRDKNEVIVHETGINTLSHSCLCLNSTSYLRNFSGDFFDVFAKSYLTIFLIFVENLASFDKSSCIPFHRTSVIQSTKFFHFLFEQIQIDFHLQFPFPLDNHCA
jgi:hypothetical protein